MYGTTFPTFIILNRSHSEKLWNEQLINFLFFSICFLCYIILLCLQHMAKNIYSTLPGSLLLVALQKSEDISS